MFYKYCVCVCLVLASCSQDDHLDYDFEISKATAIQSFENNDYEKSIVQFSYLTRLHPEDSVLRTYLAQSYIGRSGVVFANLAQKVLKLEKMNHSSLELISDFIASLPASSSKTTRLDLAQAVQTVHDFNDVYNDEDMRKNEIVFRMLYTVYLIKAIHDQILEQHNLNTLQERPQLLNTLIVKNYPELTEIVFQLKAVIQGLDSISGRLKEKIQSYLDEKNTKIKIQEKEYSLNFNNGFENGIETLIRDLLNQSAEHASTPLLK